MQRKRAMRNKEDVLQVFEFLVPGRFHKFWLYSPSHSFILRISSHSWHRLAKKPEWFLSLVITDT